MVRAYQLVGYARSRDYPYIQTNRALRALHSEVVSRVMADIEAAGGCVRRDPVSDLLTVNDGFSASLVIARCQVTAAGGLRWKVRFDAGVRPSLTIVARIAEDNAAIPDFYLLPWLDARSAPGLWLAPRTGFCSMLTDSILWMHSSISRLRASVRLLIHRLYCRPDRTLRLTALIYFLSTDDEHQLAVGVPGQA